jgi:EmrB/QacA subfamily drug resistance transporter
MSSTPGPESSRALISASPRTIALILASAIFMEQVDSTALSTALPAMARSFGVPPLQLSLAITGYLLSLAVFIPISGAAADRLGSRTIFRLAIITFTVGSIACSLASDVWMLVLARMVQGVGGAMMVPVGRLVLIRSVPKSEFVSMMAWVLVPGMIGPVVGPLLSGFLVTYLSWQWIFYINVPLGLLGVLLTTLFIPEIKAEKKEPFDLKGMALSGISLCSLIFVIESGRGGGLPLPWTAALCVVGVLSGVGYWRHARKHPAPVLDFRLAARIPTLFVASTAGFLFRMCFGAFPFLLPLLLQLGFGMSAAKSGAITFAGSVGSILMKAGAKPVLSRLGYRNTLIWNGLVCALYVAICAMFRPSWPLTAIYAILIIGGSFRSLQYTAYGTICYADIPPAKQGAAVGFHSMVQQVSVTLGVAVSATVLGAITMLGGRSMPALADFSATMLVMAGICLAAVPICFLLPPDAGAEFSGRRPTAATAVDRAEAQAPS